jgi:hypothetical protein
MILARSKARRWRISLDSPRQSRRRRQCRPAWCAWSILRRWPTCARRCRGWMQITRETWIKAGHALRQPRAGRVLAVERMEPVVDEVPGRRPGEALGGILS